LTTLVAGLTWYDLNTDQNIWNMVYVWPYAASVLGVLTAHELGHYYMAKRHDVGVSPPVYIPFPFFVGTVGAYVDIEDDIPDRKALFDIGIAGPITGIVAAVFAAAIGFHLEPVIHTSGSEPGSIWVSFVDPPLVNLVGDAMHALTGTQVHFEGRAISRSPVVFGAWIGTFVTFLNLMPAGQLDGGHISRSMLGERAKWVGLLAPAALVALGGWMFTQGKEPIARFWWFWALFILYYWYKGTVTPTRETGTIGRKRLAVLAGVIVVGALCFTPTPIDVTTVPPAVP
jgi:membrane-associated protease RseP (regulator of RpoE activity)